MTRNPPSDGCRRRSGNAAVHVAGTVEGRRLTRSGIFSFGLVLYEMLTNPGVQASTQTRLIVAIQEGRVLLRRWCR
jgi:hypothetical protein